MWLQEEAFTFVPSIVRIEAIIVEAEDLELQVRHALQEVASAICYSPPSTSTESSIAILSS